MVRGTAKSFSRPPPQEIHILLVSFGFIRFTYFSGIGFWDGERLRSDTGPKTCYPGGGFRVFGAKLSARHPPAVETSCAVCSGV